MEHINPLGFPAFQQCYGILRVSLSSKQIFFFSLTCTYCIWIMLVCLISCFVWEAIKTTLTWLDLTIEQQDKISRNNVFLFCLPELFPSNERCCDICILVYYTCTQYLRLHLNFTPCSALHWVYWASAVGNFPANPQNGPCILNESVDWTWCI